MVDLSIPPLGPPSFLPDQAPHPQHFTPLRQRLHRPARSRAISSFTTPTRDHSLSYGTSFARLTGFPFFPPKRPPHSFDVGPTHPSSVPLSVSLPSYSKKAHRCWRPEIREPLLIPPPPVAPLRKLFLPEIQVAGRIGRETKLDLMFPLPLPVTIP